MDYPNLTDCKIAIIGLGYVGLPLALEFAKTQICRATKESLSRTVVGFDINQKRLNELQLGIDSTNEALSIDFEEAKNISFTSNPDSLANADVFIVTVPTPIDSSNRPDLIPLKSASKTVGLALRERARLKNTTYPIVIYESTVFPGATEEVCVPIIESYSGLTYRVHFHCGYSPERINPGDRIHRLSDITKVTSGSSELAGKFVDSLYSSIIKAGTYKASSIKVAEASKVIENTQRDLNIALMNEIALICNKIGIDTLDVLEAAGTKWNFLPFRPGIVGGHCIGVDPYYLTHKAEQLGYHPQVVLAGRRINDSMGAWIAEKVVFEMAKGKRQVVDSKVLILGFTFKENCPDIRNTRVIDIVKTLQNFTSDITIVDPVASLDEIHSTYDLSCSPSIPSCINWDAIIVAVAHECFLSFTNDEWKSLLSSNPTIFDLKGIVPRSLNPIRL